MAPPLSSEFPPSGGGPARLETLPAGGAEDGLRRVRLPAAGAEGPRPLRDLLLGLLRLLRRLLEAADRLAQRAADLGKPVGAEEEQGEEQDDQEFGDPETEHGGSPWGRRARGVPPPGSGVLVRGSL